MKKIKLHYVAILALVLCNCKFKNELDLNLNGFYGMTNYFQSNNTNSDYVETFLLKIDTDKVTMYGTVQTWGISYKYKLNKTKDTILIENNLKIFRKNNYSNTIFLETNIDNKIEFIEFQKDSNIEKIVDENGININRLSDRLNKLIIVGKYKYKGKIVNFKENGKVENLEVFSNYSIKPRIGTNTFFDNRIIETENGIWKYQKKNGNLLITKYSNKRDENDMYILSNEQIELEKLPSH